MSAAVCSSDLENSAGEETLKQAKLKTFIRHLKALEGSHVSLGLDSEEVCLDINKKRNINL